MPRGQLIRFPKILHQHKDHCPNFWCDVESGQKYWQKGAGKLSVRQPGNTRNTFPGLSAHRSFYRTVPFMSSIYRHLQKLQGKPGVFSFFFSFQPAQLLSSPFCKLLIVYYHTVYVGRQCCGKTCYWSWFKLSEEFSLRLMKEQSFVHNILLFPHFIYFGNRNVCLHLTTQCFSTFELLLTIFLIHI